MIVPRQSAPPGQPAWRFMIGRMFLICVVLVPALPARAADTVRFDFESGDLQGQMESLIRAVVDLNETFAGEYPNGGEFLSRLERMAKQLGEQNVNFDRLAEDFESLKKQALIENPLVSAQPILFVARKQYRSDHHNTATLFQTGEINTRSFTGGAALKTIDLLNARTHTLLETSTGVIRDPEVHFDGDRIIFAMRKDIKDDYHIYEINADGTGLRQLTFAGGVSDIDPLYTADGDIVFSSTREPKYCMCNRHIMANLFRMEADGANIHQIGKSTLFEGHGSLMPDGRIMYYRWEYIDRNFGDAQGLWTVNPDGTNHAVYWGNNTNSPGAVIDARVIDGTHRVICTFSSCHDRPWGALAIVDRRLGLDGRKPVIRTWPANAVDLVGKGNYDTFKRVNPKYEDPYPLSDKYFLCSRMTGKGEQTGIYLIDIFGNEILLHVEGEGCFDPMPLAPRPRPGVIPPRRDFENKTGYMYVVDVYKGTHMKGVKPGAVKFLRVVESPEKRFWVPRVGWGGQGQEDPAMAWHDFNNKRIMYFQLLDADGMMIQSMRSGVIVQSGEQAGCVGCHDHRHTAPVPIKGKTPLALTGPPRRLSPWYGPPRLFEYITEVQPVFDRYCVRCHDYGKEAGRKLNLAADRTNTFNTSYNELWRKKYINAIGAGPAGTQQPYTWGSHRSKLVETILKGHEDVKLDRESFDRIVTWIDINAPYYARYDSSYPHNLSGRSPLDAAQIKRLTELTGVPFARLASHNANRGPQVSFDRPALSPCLAVFKDTSDARYIEALAIIRAGAQMLKEKPRADMPGFVPWEVDRRRQEKYLERRDIEYRNRLAIRAGRRLYDAP